MGELIERVKDITEFLEGAFKACEKHPLVKAVAHSTPWWVPGVVEGLSESLPVVSFIAKNAAKFLATAPQEQGRLACTLAYQRSVEQALTTLHQVLPQELKLNKSLKSVVSSQSESEIPLDGFTLDSRVLGHAFINSADERVRTFAQSVGLDDGLTSRLLNSIHGLFLTNLAVILSHPQTEDRFKNFAKFVKLEAEEQRGRRALSLHNQYTLWRYERRVSSGTSSSRSRMCTRRRIAANCNGGRSQVLPAEGLVLEKRKPRRILSLRRMLPVSHSLRPSSIY